MLACFGVKNIFTPKSKPENESSLETSEFDFPLESIHLNLQSLIVEKITFSDFASFNACSTFSSQMIEKVPKGLKPVIEARNIIICDLHGKTEFGVMLDTIVIGHDRLHIYEKCDMTHKTYRFKTNQNFNFRLHCSFLTVYRYNCMDVISLFGITAKSLQLVYLKENIQFIDSLLKMTKASSYRGAGCSNEFFSLQSVQKLSDLHIDFALRITDDFLLSLTAPKMSLSGNFTITSTGIARFLMEWKSGLRQIEGIKLFLFTGHVTMPSVRSSLQEEEYTKDSKNPDCIYMCRSNKHRDCIKASVNTGFQQWVFSSEIECPKRNVSVDG